MDPLLSGRTGLIQKSVHCKGIASIPKLYHWSPCRWLDIPLQSWSWNTLLSSSYTERESIKLNGEHVQVIGFIYWQSRLRVKKAIGALPSSGSGMDECGIFHIWKCGLMRTKEEPSFIWMWKANGAPFQVHTMLWWGLGIYSWAISISSVGGDYLFYVNHGLQTKIEHLKQRLIKIEK